MTVQLTQESVYIPGPRGRLAGEMTYPDDGPVRAAVLIANPHPLMGGAMQNNIVERLAGDLPTQRFATLRFDYSGVGHSGGAPVDVAENMRQFWETGTSPADPGMAQDVGCASAWLRLQFDLPQIGIGYSFGAYALVSSSLKQLDGLIMISPTVTRHDFTPLHGARLGTMVVYSDDDFATPIEVTQDWLRTLDPPTKGHLVSGGEHFYRGLEPVVIDLCAEFINETINTYRGAL